MNKAVASPLSLSVYSLSVVSHLTSPRLMDPLSSSANQLRELNSSLPLFADSLMSVFVVVFTQLPPNHAPRASNAVVAANSAPSPC